MNRRSILKLLGAAPVAAPLAAKAASDAAISEMTKLNATGLGASNGPSSMGRLTDTASHARAMLKLPKIKDQLITLIYEEERNIYCLDVDIANKHSFSLAAKITFQRQRNVNRRLKLLQEEENVYNRIDRLIQKFAEGKLWDA